MTKHNGKNLKTNGGWMTVLGCSGRAVSNPFALATSPAEVTCKACLKKIPAVVPNMPAGVA